MDRAEIEKISRALADTTRLCIFEAISAGDQLTCGDLVSMRGVTPATVSHHLKILSEADWSNAGAKASVYKAAHCPAGSGNTAALWRRSQRRRNLHAVDNTPAEEMHGNPLQQR